MLPRDDRIRLQHMLEAAQRLTDFVRGRTAAELDNDHQLAYAVSFGLAVIGEAANHVSAQTRAYLPRVPWAQIIRMRNRLIHAYSDINAQVV